MKKIVIFYILLSFTTLYGTDYSKIPDDELVQLAENGDSEAQYNLGELLNKLIVTNDKLRLNYLERTPYKWYELAMEQNHPSALTKIGKEYLSPFGHYKVQDYTKAIELLKLATTKNNEADLILSVLHYFGLGTLEDKAAALNYLKISQTNSYRYKPILYIEKELIDMVRDLVKTENPEALFLLGEFYYFGNTEYYKQDYTKAYRVYLQSAELGSGCSSYMAGMMLYKGQGILKDLISSFIWISKSANSGYLDGITKAGIMNYFGEGTEENFTEASRLFQIAAEKEDPLAQYFLGVMYYKGQGVEKDLPLCKKWIEKAYKNGTTTAKKFWDSKELWKI